MNPVVKPLVIAVTAATSLCSATFVSLGSAHAKGPATKTAAHKTALICPVTGDKISSVKAAVGHTVYKGKTYYFCCPGCKPRFDKDPAKFIKNAAKGKFEKM